MMTGIGRQDGPHAVKAALFDFDGTLSTLRQGWEAVMEPYMVEVLVAAGLDAAQARLQVHQYVDASTGIQTYRQMEWLAARVSEREAPLDPWQYKREYNRRLMLPVKERIRQITSGACTPEDYLVPGSLSLLQALRDMGVVLYLASGTDHADVERESVLLGVRSFFREVAGAPPGVTDCSKETVLRQLLEGQGLRGGELVVVGDGRVEIALGREAGARTIGVASDETGRQPFNRHKEARLRKAGADWIIGDFRDTPGIVSWLCEA